MEMKVLHLILKKKWFDMILSGEKKEEYREFGDYWLKRLSNFFETAGCIEKSKEFPDGYEFNHYDIVCFRHGYAANAPEIRIECLGIKEGRCRPNWSDNAKGTHIVISLGNIISTNNIS